MVEKGWVTYGDGNYSSKYPKASELSDQEGVPFISGKNLRAGRITSEGMRYISEDLHSQLKKGHIKSGDTLLVTRAGVGAVAYVTDEYEGANINAQLVYLRADNKNIDSEYLYFYLSSKPMLDTLIAFASGSAQGQLPIKSLLQVPVTLVEFKSQRSIAKILGDLDRKIELNRRTNETLEQIGQNLFKHYFIDNPESENWVRVPMSEVCEKIASGGTPATKEASYYSGDIDWYSTKELQDNFLFKSEKTITDEGLAKSSAKLFPINTVVMAIYAAPTVGRLGVLSKESSFNQAACGLVAKDSFGYEFIYLHLLTSRDILNNMANGAAQQNISVGKVRDFKTVQPDEETMKEFRRNIKPFFEKIKNNSAEIETLVNLRDSLLPRLLSGQITV